ncbi:hypothetical protein OF83DRAFT_1288582 [Amylostereum chailletii]|nr:hypothetical protein OF83DRAFT_1288582 [Amylostereum chailletii]
MSNRRQSWCTFPCVRSSSHVLEGKPRVIVASSLPRADASRLPSPIVVDGADSPVTVVDSDKPEPASGPPLLQPLHQALPVSPSPLPAAPLPLETIWLEISLSGPDNYKVSNKCCRIENKKNTLEGSTGQVSKQGLCNTLYQKNDVVFPEGWMSSGQISRDDPLH